MRLASMGRLEYLFGVGVTAMTPTSTSASRFEE
jgi:hypothetical protein